jgi:hypothetical protein
MAEYWQIQHNSENVFGIENPDEISCSIRFYTPSHSQLCIRLFGNSSTSTTESTSYVTFAGVRYFQCPSTWKGANFKTAPLEECFNLISDISAEEGRESLLQSYRLYTVETKTLQIRILGVVSHYGKEPDEYQKIIDNELLERISMDPITGEPQIVWTRLFENAPKPLTASITVAKILERLEAGDSYQDILYYFDGLSQQDIQACLAYARRAITPKTDT